MKTILFFSQLVQCLIIMLMLQPVSAAQNTPTNSETEMVIYDFKKQSDLEDWRVVNDGVMGGLSRGEIIMTESGTAVFQGVLSLENNGGFSSTRTLPRPYNLDDYHGVSLRVRGDGNTYQFRLRLDDRFDGVAYRYSFQTKVDEWMTVEIPFSECVPVFRGRKLSGVAPVAPEKVQQIGFLISDKQAGPFRLEIDWIKARQR
ncbi:MAG: CIA30 family protein [Desulfofustis sp.]|nr:CIA30 family protein [Desulfofustis sp.]